MSHPAALGVAATVAALLAGASAALAAIAPPSVEMLFVVGTWTLFALALLLALASLVRSRLGRRSRAALRWGLLALAILAAYVAWGVWMLCGWGC